jgi:hypothetical protein
MEAAILTANISISDEDPEPVADAAAALYRAPSTMTRSSWTDTSESTPEMLETGDRSSDQMHGKRLSASNIDRPSKRRRKGLSTSNCRSDYASASLPSDLAVSDLDCPEDAPAVNTDAQISVSSVDVERFVLRAIVRHASPSPPLGNKVLTFSVKVL